MDISITPSRSPNIRKRLVSSTEVPINNRMAMENNRILLILLNNKGLAFDGPNGIEDSKVSSIVQQYVNGWKNDHLINANPAPQYLTYLPNMTLNDMEQRNSILNVGKNTELYRLITYLHKDPSSPSSHGMRLKENDGEIGTYSKRILDQLELECIMETLCYLYYASPKEWYPAYKNAVIEYFRDNQALLQNYPRLDDFLKKKPSSEIRYLEELMSILLPLSENTIPALASLNDNDYTLIGDQNSLFISELPIIYVNTSVFYILLGRNSDVYTYYDQYTGKHTIIGYVNSILQKVTYTTNS